MYGCMNEDEPMDLFLPFYSCIIDRHAMMPTLKKFHQIFGTTVTKNMCFSVSLFGSNASNQLCNVKLNTLLLSAIS